MNLVIQQVVHAGPLRPGLGAGASGITNFFNSGAFSALFADVCEWFERFFGSVQGCLEGILGP